MYLVRRIFDYRLAPLIVIAFVSLFYLEGKRPLRKRKQLRLKRLLLNTSVAIPSFLSLRLLFLPLMVKLALKNKSYRYGLNNQYQAPAFVKAILVFFIMDYSNYLWHVVNHKVPFLWRFHLVHHTDLDLDVSTAIRFHFGEIAGSIFFRGLFIFIAGASWLQVIVYEALFEIATQFHHSNLKLPYQYEMLLNKFIVTPRMHGIHHSIVRRETNSNYSVILSVWDRLHHSLNLEVPQEKIVIGVPSYQDKKELTTTYLLKLPFIAVRPWDQQ